LIQRTIFLTNVRPKNIETILTDGLISPESRDALRRTIEKEDALLRVDGKHAIADAFQNFAARRLDG
jgi:hypothetical protein